jgi:site-specific recombinase XerD
LLTRNSLRRPKINILRRSEGPLCPKSRDPATLLYHGLRREELCTLNVKDLHSRQGVMHFRIKGKRSKIRFVVVNPAAQRLIEEYLDRADIDRILTVDSSGQSKTIAP